jgi:hypothetical protein
LLLLQIMCFRLLLLIKTINTHKVWFVRSFAFFCFKTNSEYGNIEKVFHDDDDDHDHDAGKNL